MKPGTSSGPGPGYSLPGLLTTRNDFNKAPSTGAFHSPIAKPVDYNKSTPAPNQYNVRKLYACVINM